jgi:hypothetical protein
MPHFSAALSKIERWAQQGSNIIPLWRPATRLSWFNANQITILPEFEKHKIEAVQRNT